MRFYPLSLMACHAHHRNYETKTLQLRRPEGLFRRSLAVKRSETCLQRRLVSHNHISVEKGDCAWFLCYDQALFAWFQFTRNPKHLVQLCPIHIRWDPVIHRRRCDALQTCILHPNWQLNTPWSMRMVAQFAKCADIRTPVNQCQSTKITMTCITKK